ncbi:MAG TPA: adenylate/guanylate cyclase domain-containing protein, partial [Nitrososphaerales archaeon]
GLYGRGGFNGECPMNIHNGFNGRQVQTLRGTGLSQGTRRLAAIMFTDMVGYTTLGQRNELLSLALVEEQRKLMRPIITRHNGREVKTMGDAFMVEFPSALDAVRCAYDIQRAARELNFSLPEDRRIHLRIGVHLGDVMESSGDISGDAVNIASRIEPLAEDGGVSMSRQVYDQVHNKFGLPIEGVGSRQLKNVVAPVEVYRIVMPWGEEPKSTQLDSRRVAVLPFTNMSPDPNDEFFAEGMTEELIATISKIREFSVISRTSVMQYKAGTKGVGAIGSELHAGTALEGSVRKYGNRMRITVQLVDVNQDKHLWSQSYDRDVQDVFAVQSDIAQRVASSLKVELLAGERDRLEARSTHSSEAYVLYLKGRHYWNERTKESVEKAVRYFTSALEKDGQFALAYAGLADAYTVMLDRGWADLEETRKLGLANARRALELDDSLAEAHAALGGTYEEEFQWEAAEREFKRAIELNPSLSQAHFWLSNIYLTMEQWEKAIDEDMKALELDPLSKHIRGVTSYNLVLAGRLDEAIQLAEDVLAEYPDAYWAHLALSYACFKKSLFDRALEEARKGYLTGGGQSWPASFYFYILKETGRLEEAKAEAKRYLETDGALGWNPSQVAMVYLTTNDIDTTFRLLNEAYEKRDPGLKYLGFPPIFDSVRSDPRFLELARKVLPR